MHARSDGGSGGQVELEGGLGPLVGTGWVIGGQIRGSYPVGLNPKSARQVLSTA